jgi:glycosyltransferase involved in cell wall biosynthesis
MVGSREKITVLIEAVNEVHLLKECIESAHLLTDNVILIDQASTDDSVKVALDLKAKVIQHDPVTVVEEIRKFGIDKVTTEWVFILDADERITESLAKIIDDILCEGVSDITHYKVPRRNTFGGTTWLKHGGWWPDEQLRMIKLSAFVDWPTPIHSTPKIEGTMAILTEPLVHHFHGDITKMVEKTALFEEVESNLLYKAGRKSGTLIFIRKFMGELNRRLFRNAGFMDGPIGIIESCYQAYSKTITYLYLYEKQKSRPL